MLSYPPSYHTLSVLQTWTNVANMQLGDTLTWLHPANAIGQFTVDVPVMNLETGEGAEDAPSVPGKYKGKEGPHKHDDYDGERSHKHDEDDGYKGREYRY